MAIIKSTIFGRSSSSFQATVPLSQSPSSAIQRSSAQLWPRSHPESESIGTPNLVSLQAELEGSLDRSLDPGYLDSYYNLGTFCDAEQLRGGFEMSANGASNSMDPASISNGDANLYESYVMLTRLSRFHRTLKWDIKVMNFFLLTCNGTLSAHDAIDRLQVSILFSLSPSLPLSLYKHQSELILGSAFSCSERRES